MLASMSACQVAGVQLSFCPSLRFVETDTGLWNLPVKVPSPSKRLQVHQVAGQGAPKRTQSGFSNSSQFQASSAQEVVSNDSAPQPGS